MPKKEVTTWVNLGNYGQEIEVFVDGEVVERHVFWEKGCDNSFEAAVSHANVLKKRWQRKLNDMKNLGWFKEEAGDGVD